MLFSDFIWLDWPFKVRKGNEDDLFVVIHVSLLSLVAMFNIIMMGDSQAFVLSADFS